MQFTIESKTHTLHSVNFNLAEFSPVVKSMLDDILTNNKDNNIIKIHLNYSDKKILHFLEVIDLSMKRILCKDMEKLVNAKKIAHYLECEDRIITQIVKFEVDFGTGLLKNDSSEEIFKNVYRNSLKNNISTSFSIETNSTYLCAEKYSIVIINIYNIHLDDLLIPKLSSSTIFPGIIKDENIIEFNSGNNRSSTASNVKFELNYYMKEEILLFTDRLNKICSKLRYPTEKKRQNDD